MNSKLVTLSTIGTLDDPLSIYERVLAYAFSSFATQTIIYAGNVLSISDIYSRSSTEPVLMSGILKSELTKTLNNYFDGVQVSCVIKPLENSANKFEIFVDSAINDKDGLLNASHVVWLDGVGVLSKIISRSNEGKL